MVGRLFPLVVAALLTLVGCTSGGGNDSDGSCSTLGTKITNGEECSRSSSNPVVLIILTAGDDQVQGLCTGTLITNRDILTAAHCMPDGVGFLVNINGNLFPATAAIPHPKYDGAVPSQYDAGILRLAAPQVIEPAALLLSRSPEIGDKVTAYGYGVDEDGESAVEKGDESLRAGRMRISGVQGGTLVAEFKEADESNTSICFGDSGGPAVLEKDGAVGIVGINNAGLFAGGGGQCTFVQAAFFTDIQNVIDFVLKHVPDARVS